MQAFTPAMTVNTERRKKLRNRPRSLVYIELESANGGMMRDLSEEGFALRAMMPLQAGGKTQFAFSLDEGTRISGEGRIVWIKEDGRVAGIEFCGIPNSARKQIREWLAGTDQPTARDHRRPAIAVPEASTLEELREEARSTLAPVVPPSVEPAKASVPSSEPESLPAAIPVPPPVEQAREEARITLPRIALPLLEPARAAPSSEAESPPAAIPVPPPVEHAREEARFALPRIALPSMETPRAAPSSEAESPPAAIPVPPPVEHAREEARIALPRIALPLVEPPRAAPSSEPEVARVVISEPAEVAELRVTPTESATAPSPKTQTEFHAISGETFPAAALEPLVMEAAIDPLLGLQLETDFSETLDEHRASRSLLMRVIGMIVLLTLVVGAAVFHREIGHALIWLGQVIAGPEEAPRPRSSVAAEPPTQATAAPETTGPVSSPAVSDSSAISPPQGDHPAPSETQPAAKSRVIEVPPILPAEPPFSPKTPSAPVLQPTSQQNRVPAPAGSSGTAADNGQQEFHQAEQILRSRSSEAELGVAARLLWVAVEKGNAGAELALAELYRQGRGVAKNCDQAADSADYCRAEGKRRSAKAPGGAYAGRL
jgi:hypothetical protein